MEDTQKQDKGLNSSVSSMWIYTEDKLREKHDAKQQRYKYYVDQVHKASESMRMNSVKISVDPKNLHFDRFDEQIILHFMMQNMCTEISKVYKNLKYEIYHYAQTLFRRYYLSNTLLDTNSRDMMYTCIIMAVKLSENKNVKIKNRDRTESSDIFEYISKEKAEQYKVKEIYAKTEMKLLKSMNYDLHIINPFQTLHGLMALWDKTFPNKTIEVQVLEEMNLKQLKAHKGDTQFQHNMIMVAFAVFYERMYMYSEWQEYNKQIPYINDNALCEAKMIIECMNKSVQEQTKIETSEKASINKYTQRFLDLYKGYRYVTSRRREYPVPQNRPGQATSTGSNLGKREVPGDGGDSKRDSDPMKQLKK